jgi:hypothetical protein
VRTLALIAAFVVPTGLAAQAGGTKAPAQTKTPPTTTAQQQSKAPPADNKAAPTGTKSPAQNTKGAAPRRQTGMTVAPESTAARAQIPVIMREAYDYDAAGRRDPFFSLMSTEDVRPAISDLRLVNIIFDESGRRPIAVMRDVANNTQYRVTNGSTLGRMKVALIKRRVVIFSIEEFGLNRQDSLILGDTTKARAR